jgi:hypothetical protein
MFSLISGLALVAAGCGGAAQAPPPRLAVQLPREASGPLDSPAIQAAFAIQRALDLPAAPSTMQAYLGRRYGGDWIVNNGKRGILYVGVVHLTAADQSYARSHIHLGRHASLRLVNETFSATQLNSFDRLVVNYVEHRSTSKVLAEHPLGSFGVSAVNNAVDLSVPKSDASFWIAPIRRLIPYDALVIQYSSSAAVAS